MGFMDGAVNGMMTRLVPAGFMPDEAFCLGQAAYIKEGKRDPGVPPAVVDRQSATALINQTLTTLGTYPMGVEAHIQRIRLWERIFGFRSWHEPIDPEEVYGPIELLTLGYSVPASQASGGRAIAPQASPLQTEAPGERTFRIVVGSSQDGGFIDQMTEALQKAENLLRREVESTGYVWNGDDGDYSIFTVGDDDLPEGIPDGALDRYFPGTVCALGVITAGKK
ncbi:MULTISPECIES: hypothetical protein [unclassified Arthrobacter]|uniref:hypothetical protein n=1 Tax=unclassified Arthrobacter TaxID=235627 RepID=UPI001F1C58DD|nr:hypothetical protein [Arthrobacter sp. FW305-BF8]UKA56135.1 hypothetical protein LFT45_09600 [Arthrobacter sp. FW305-BF8]